MSHLSDVQKLVAAQPLRNELASCLPSEFMTRYTKLREGPYSFKGHEHLLPFVDCTSPEAVLMKISQAGASEAGGRLCAAKSSQGQNIGYVMPGKAEITDLLAPRMRRLLESSSSLAIEGRASDITTVIQFRGGGAMRLMYSGAQAGGHSVDLDGFFIDELDRCDPGYIEEMEGRLGHAYNPWRRWVCTPTRENVGIHALYLTSSQAMRMHKCPGCGFWQPIMLPNLMFHQHVPPFGPGEKMWANREYYTPIYLNAEPYFGCVKCRAELDQYTGEWVHKYERERKGFWITAFAFPRVSRTGHPAKADEEGVGNNAYTLVRSFLNLKPSPEALTNFLRQGLGLPTNQLMGEMNQFGPLYLPSLVDENYTLGDTRVPGYTLIAIDQRRVLNIVIARVEYPTFRVIWAETLLLDIGHAEVMAHIKRLIAAYATGPTYKYIGVIDSEPDLTLPGELKKIGFLATKKHKLAEPWRYVAADHLLIYDRNTMYGKVACGLRRLGQETIALPGDGWLKTADGRTFREQVEAPYFNGASWASSGRDDYYSCLSCMIAYATMENNQPDTPVRPTAQLEIRTWTYGGRD